MTDSKVAVAKQLYVSPSTVVTHIRRIRQKYDMVGRPAKTKAALLIRALQDGHVEFGEFQ